MKDTVKKIMGRPRDGITRDSFNLKVDVRAIAEFKNRADKKGMSYARYFNTQYSPK